MILLINTSTLSGTGVCQVATSFIYECRYFKNNHFHVFLSRTMSLNIRKSDFSNNFIFYEINSHPIYGIKGYIEKRKMQRLEKKINPDCVFSVFGPSCWTPNAPHLIGYALGHYVYPDSPIYNLMTCRESLHRRILKLFHRYYLLKDGDYYVCETEDVATRLSKFLKVDKKYIFTVGNTCNQFFINYVPQQKKKISPSGEFRFLSLCSPYKHKNLEILNRVIPLLLKDNLGFNFKFVVTINKRSYDTIFTDLAKKYVVNVGKLLPSECPQIYSECDALFAPTLLECFSANYPEAMFMGKPILTSNLSFATSICGKAALYFDPLNPCDVADKIKILLSSKNEYDKLVSLGYQQFATFESSLSRTEKYLSICEQIGGKQYV